MDHLSLSDVNILLIEPSDTQRKIISSLLIKENVGSVDSVSTLAEAKSALQSHRSDVVVSTMYFEDGTGLDLIKYIKSNTETASIPFMLVSSENHVAKLEEFKQAGVAAILPKPFKPIHLTRALNATLDLINTEELELEYYDVNNVRVLLVDDSRLARNHIRRVLEGSGLTDIKEAENGASALTLLKDNVFDLVVTDYNMPEMDGRELSEYIRFNPETSHIPIIMVTSEATNSAHMANIQQTGVNALCDKPFEAQEVRKILATLLGN
ncbi:response regulator [Aliiglaciecola sp. 3_MG-2023]|uniref:response regulator n=1 Tax=Aliiglaciecola sp. 3_MG-2023 TaxID=3062644 RepID=UPI0026E3A6D4|nr:response regulator [Aliiglaciecola sp. 3_MG-2023]MDO6691665.1 response regulator [Aliiglaciecola sp. 3_MG-2023]